jgi:hypothetical protein
MDNKTPQPNQSFYAAFVEETIQHEGDQRSRDCPGHGYPAYSETYTSVVKFKDEEALKCWVLANDSGYSRKNYTLFSCTPITAKKTITFSYGG